MSAGNPTPGQRAPTVPDVWEARPPPQLLLAVSVVAVLVTLDGMALGRLVSTGERSPQTIGAVAISLAAAQVAVATIFFTLGGVGFARKAVLVLAAIAYGGALVAAANWSSWRRLWRFPAWRCGWPACGSCTALLWLT